MKSHHIFCPLVFSIMFLLGIASFFFTSTASAQIQFPYKAVVCEAEAFARSGPGTDFYATNRLQNGESVEVYKHTPDGWCAIRPPLGSFSYISARYVQMAQNDLGQIVGGAVPVYVGSGVSPERSQVQITLAAGKIVEVIEPPTNGFEALCKIAPPAGEFRWIHGKFLTPNQTGVTEVPTPPSRVVADALNNTPNSSWTTVDGTPLGNVSGINSGIAGGSSNGDFRNLPAREMKPGTFIYYVNQLDADFSYIIASGDASKWETEALLMRANRLMQYAKSTEERDHLERIRQKIIEADGVRKKRQEFQRLLATANGGNVTPLASPSGTQSDFSGVSEFPAPFSAEPGRWDYSGILVRVLRQKYTDLALPQYAIVNEDGVLRCYVTPQPNMDLSPYVKKRVTFAGDRNYLREQRAFNLNVKIIVNAW